MILRYNGPEDMKRVSDYLLTLTSPHDVIIETPKCTISQNSTIHANMQIIASHTGYSLEEMKDILKDGITEIKWLKMKYSKFVKGKDKEFYRSTKDLDTKELSLFLDYIWQVGELQGLKMLYPSVQMAEELFK